MAGPGKEDRAVSRRRFVKGMAAGVAAFSIVPRHVLGGSGQRPPSEKLNIGCIAAAGRGNYSIRGVAKTENIAALCDVDTDRARSARKRFSKAKFYTDYRKLLDEMSNELDAVTVATPDHSHFHATLSAMQLGLHVYCEKPLAHTVSQVRRLTEAARKYDKVVTQMGNQGHSCWSTAKMRDWILAGAIGPVHEVVAWKHGNYSRHHPPTKDSVPKSLDYDLWLNREPHRPYHRGFHPGSWRGWSYFGTGTVGDWGCHQLDPAFYALDLTNPERVTVEPGKWPVRDSYPETQLLTWHIPKRGDQPAIRVRYYILGDTPAGKGVPDLKHVPPKSKPRSRVGAAMVGEKATIIYGSHGGGGHIVPEEKMKEAGDVPERSPRVRDHQGSWLDACKGRGQALSSFDYAGPLAEFVLLGEVALRSDDHEIRWDGEAMKVPNDPKATALVHGTDPRDGWRI